MEAGALLEIRPNPNTSRSFAVWDQPNKGYDSGATVLFRLATEVRYVIWIGDEEDSALSGWLHVITPYGLGWMRATCFEQL
jgi:hypothetical protein